MRANVHFSIPLKGLMDGTYEFKFEAAEDFFKKFENSPIGKGNFEIETVLQKKSDHLELNFSINGKVATTCDRCVADIMLPIEGNHQLIVKYTMDELTQDEEVWSITYDTHDLVIDRAIYEFIILSMPIVKTFDCDLEIPRPCNDVAVDKLEEEVEIEEEAVNPFAEALKNIELN